MNKKQNFWMIFAGYYLPVLLWMSLIFYFSSIPGLRSGTSSIAIEIFLRKSAHIFEYLILAILLGRIFNFYWKTQSLKIGIATFLISIFYSISDEVHQFFVDDRSGRVFDVMIDGIGILLGILVLFLISKIKEKK